MPSRNSPSNVAGKTEETMSKEFIVIMQKDSTHYAINPDRQDSFQPTII